MRRFTRSGSVEGKSCKVEWLTEHTPQDVPCNTTLVQIDLQCMHYQEMMKPCPTTKHGTGFAMVLQGDALHFEIR